MYKYRIVYFKPRFIYNAINNYRNFSLDRLMKKGIEYF